MPKITKLEEWYSQWSILLAKQKTKEELEKRLKQVEKELSKASDREFKAIQASGSMQQNSQRRAHAYNTVSGLSTEMFALNGAIEIHEKHRNLL